MLRYFPKPYPGEIFYSWIARYQRQTMVSSKSIFRDLFGCSNNPVSLSLPLNLTKFTKAISFVSQLSAEAIIKDMTLWPYLSSTITKEKQRRILKLIKYTPSGGKGPNTLVARKRIQEARYCVFCSQKDLAKYGEVFLHVEHQIPNVLICTIHNCFLKDFQLSSKTLSNNLLIALPPEVCNDDPPVFNTNALLLKVALRMVSVAQGEDISKTLDIQFLRSFGMKAKYILRQNWNFGKLNTDITSFYKELEAHPMLRGREGKLLLPNYFWNQAKTGLNPFFYILILLFIENKLEAIDETEVIDEIICVNPVCNYFNKVVTHREELIHQGKSARPAKIVTCRCGMRTKMLYDRYGSLKKRVLLDRGHLWTKKLKDGIRQRLSQSELGKLLDVDPTTVSYHANRFGIKHAWNIKRGIPKKKSKKKKKVNKSELRKAWLKILNSPNFKTISDSRIGNWGVYNKLKEVDLKWLKATNKSRYIKGVKKITLTDKQLDNQLYEKILKGYEELKNSNPRARITKFLICKAAGLRNSPEHSKRNLIRSTRLLNKLQESVEDNQIRRITMAAETIKASGRIVKKDELKVKASIHKHSSSAKAWKYLESLSR